jgi:hypothetical protein
MTNQLSVSSKCPTSWNNNIRKEKKKAFLVIVGGTSQYHTVRKEILPYLTYLELIIKAKASSSR